MSAETTVTRIPIEALVEAEGVIAQTITAPDGSFTIPEGIDISTMKHSLRRMIGKMREFGIEHAYVKRIEELSNSDIESIIERVDAANICSVIEKDVASSVIDSISDLFNDFKRMQREFIDAETHGDKLGLRSLEQLMNLANELADSITHEPSVIFSLGKVRVPSDDVLIHSFNVGVISGFIAHKMNRSDGVFLRKMVVGGLLHDIGKVAIPPEILDKPGRLTQDEFEVIKKHPMLGVKLAVKNGVTDSDIVATIGSHHEKWTGKGYPHGTSGSDIPVPARIAAVADVFDAITAHRTYKPPMSGRGAVSLILNGSHDHFDPRIVRELLIGLGLYPPGSIVTLSDGRRAIVVACGGQDLMRPVVMIQSAVPGRDGDASEFIDLKGSDIRIEKFLGFGAKRDIPLHRRGR